MVKSGMDNHSDGGRFLMVPARLTTMTPATDQNIQWFGEITDQDIKA